MLESPLRASRVASIVPLLVLAVSGCAVGDSVSEDDTDQGAAALGVARGVDYAWGRPSPHGLKADGYGFVARYLSYDTTGKTLTKGEADELIGAGLDIVCDWEQSGTAALDGYDQGRSDAEEAAKLAKDVGMPSDRPIYFSVDFDAQPSQQGSINAYYDGVASVIGRARTGAYGGYYLVDRLFDDHKIAWAWQAYAWSDGNWDSRAQMRQTLNDQEVAGGSVDLDLAMKDDFGQWGHDTPKPPPPAVAKEQKVGAGVTRNADGRLEAFAFASNGSLAHAWQSKPNGSWSGWASLGGTAIDTPTVLANKDGRLEAFVSTVGGTVWHIWQTTAGGSWSHWSELGDLGDAASAPAVAANEDGRLEVFVTTSGGGVEHIWQETAGGWSDWTKLDGAASTAPAVGVNEDGRLEVFVTTSSGALEHIWQTAPNGSWSGWSNLGGSGRSAPAIGRNADGRLELFVTTKSNAVEHIWQKSAGGAWSDWSSLGGCNKSGVSIEINEDGRLEGFVEGCSGSVWHIWQTSAGGAWSSWAALGGESNGAPIAARDADGRLEVFVANAGKVDHIWQDTSGGWSSWANLGAP